MTPARSLAANVVLLGFASVLTAPAAPALAAPAPCERAENYAAQSGAEALRVNRLSVQAAQSAERAVAPAPSPASTPSPSADESASTDHGAGPEGPAARSSAPAQAANDRKTHADANGGNARTNAKSAKTQTDANGGNARTNAKSAKTQTDANGGNTRTNANSGNTGSDANSRNARTNTKGGRTGTNANGGKARSKTLSGFGLSDARTVMIATGRVNSAAVARIVDGRASGKAALTAFVGQQAPPDHDRAATRRTTAGRIGPLQAGAGAISAQARWDAAMACGETAGEAAHSAARMTGASLLPGPAGTLVRVPEGISSQSTTALERRGDQAWTVASATVAAGRIELAGGRVRVRVLRPPTLVASMSAGDGGGVHYAPPAIEISGDGIRTRRLTSAGQSVELPLTAPTQTPESGLASTDDVRRGSPLPLPEVPGLPVIGAAEPESAGTPGAGSKVRVSLGDVRQARKGHAVAARADAIKVAITQEWPGEADAGQDEADYGTPATARVSADLAFGALEVAAVAPDTAGTADTAAAGKAASAGAGAWLPITGPRVGLLGVTGLGLLVTGGAALLAGTLRRRSRR
jgi:hypothetical protein